VGYNLSATIRFDLHDPAVKTKLAMLPEKMTEHGFEALLQQAHLIVGLAQVGAPVKTGAGRDTIRVERGGEGARWRQVSIRMNGYVINPDTGKLVNYMQYQEFGTKHMVPKLFLTHAIMEVRPTIADMIKNKVVQKCNE
jgi:HK97 gp10 family phage protein